MVNLQVLNTALLLATSILAINIPQTPTWPSGRCTDKSLTIPSWVISKYKVSGGKTTFVVDNRASDPTGLIAEFTCTSDNKCQSTTGGGEMIGTLTRGPDGRSVVSLTQFWTCADTGDKTIFTAKGSVTITQCAGPNCVSPITYLMYGSLSLPIPLTPTQPSPPAGYDAPTCAGVGKSQWTISDVSYRNYTKGQCKQWYQVDQICLDNNNFGTYISKGVHLTLNVTNNAISHEVTCKFKPDYSHFSPPSPLRCMGGNFNEITVDITWSGTAPNFILKVEELWYCLENPSTNVNPAVIVASGSVPISLLCTTTTGITNTPDDIVTSCTDPATSHSVDGNQDSKQVLPPFSLVTAYPSHGGCTFDSIINPTFYYRSMYFTTNPFPASNPNSATINKFTAGLTGPGFADFSFYNANDRNISGTGIDTVYTCNVYYDGKPEADHFNCTYSFNPHTKVITQDKVWRCSDKNPAAPIYFDGSGSFDWSVDPFSTCSNVGGVMSCYWHDDMANLQPGVPYDIPKVTASLVNILPPHYDMQSTVRVKGKWAKINGPSTRKD